MNDKNDLSLYMVFTDKTMNNKAESVMPCFKQLTISTIRKGMRRHNNRSSTSECRKTKQRIACFLPAAKPCKDINITIL